MSLVNTVWASYLQPLLHDARKDHMTLLPAHLPEYFAEFLSFLSQWHILRNSLPSLHPGYLCRRLSFLPLLFLLHKRKRQHLSNTVVVGQEHDHAIDAHAESSRRRQRVLERIQEGVVDELGLIVALGFL